MSWLIEGEIEHRDSLGTQALVSPGTLNIMTAGHGIVHGAGRDMLWLAAGAEGVQVLLLSGAPFAEEIVMWWNFIGRSHEEIGSYRELWASRDTEAGTGRFPPVVDRGERGDGGSGHADRAVQGARQETTPVSAR